MSRRHVAMAAIATLGGLLLSSAVRADPQGAALIVGSANYTSLPPLIGCGRSANAISAALRGLNFQINERQDASTGGIDAGMGEFADHLAAVKGPGFIYVCGYAAEFNNRTFLLPSTVRLGRPADVITQGVLAKSMLDTTSRDAATVALVIFDLIPQPDPTQRVDLDSLANSTVSDGVGIIAATETATTQAPTPLAAALVAALAGPVVRTDAVLASVRAKLTGTPGTAVAWHVPLHPGFLAGAPPPAPPPAPPLPAPVAAPVPTPAVPPVAAPVVAGAPTQMPDETQMSEFDRRQVQDALRRLGYYDAGIDAVFGPETRAAIRRYQHEIGSEMTGHLTADQATRLVNSR